MLHKLRVPCLNGVNPEQCERFRGRIDYDCPGGIARYLRGEGLRGRGCVHSGHPHRFDADDPATAADARLRAFSARILPSIVRSLADGADGRTLDFETTIPLEPGRNVLSVIARQGERDVTRRTVVIYRDSNGQEK